MLTVLERLGKISRRKRGGVGRTCWAYRARCECGNIVERPAYTFSTRYNPSCGCSRRRYRTAQEGPSQIPRKYLYTLLNNAKDRGMEVAVTQEALWELFESQSRKCALSGMPIHFGDSNSTGLVGKKCLKMTASLDRIDSSKDYVPGNVQWVHKAVNLMKMDLPEAFFISVCRRISEHSP